MLDLNLLRATERQNLDSSLTTSLQLCVLQSLTGFGLICCCYCPCSFLLPLLLVFCVRCPAWATTVVVQIDEEINTDPINEFEISRPVVEPRDAYSYRATLQYIDIFRHWL